MPLNFFVGRRTLRLRTKYTSTGLPVFLLCVALRCFALLCIAPTARGAPAFSVGVWLRRERHGAPANQWETSTNDSIIPHRDVLRPT